MDGILVQDSDWSSKLSNSLAGLLGKKQLCDLGIVCGVQNDVSNLKSNEIVMVHRCILAGASETIRKLSIGGQVYNLVKINGIDISTECWDNVLDFVYKSKTTVLARNLCDVKKAAQVLQIKPLETAVDLHHMNFLKFISGKKNVDAIENSQLSDESETGHEEYEVLDNNWLTVLFEGMLDLLVKQSLCNMTIITEKQDKVPAEILAHLCMLVASSATIKELVFQGTETYNSVKIDSISYNTWLYLLEYIYTSRVSIVKSNIPEVWVASQLLQIDGLANAVAPFASQMGATAPVHRPLQGVRREEENDQVNSSLIRVKKELLFDEKTMSLDSPSTSGSSVKRERVLEEILVNKSCPLEDTDASSDSHIRSISSVSSDRSSSCGLTVPATTGLSDDNKSGLIGTSLNDALVAQIQSPLLNVNIGLPGGVLTPVQAVGQQLVLQGGGALSTLIRGNGQGQLVNAVQSDGTSAMLWLPANQILPVVSNSQAAAENNSVSPTSKMGMTNIVAMATPGSDQLVTSSTSEQTQAAIQQQHDNNSVFVCSFCSQVYTQNSELEKHLFEEHDVSPSSPNQRLENSTTDMNKLKCKFCNKVFSRTWTLNVHLRTHTGERPYRCKTCGKAFSDKSNMRQHSLIHTSKKEYNCPKCNQAFAQKRYMKKHYIETCLRKVTPSSLQKMRNDHLQVQIPKSSSDDNLQFVIAYIGDTQTGDTSNIVTMESPEKEQANSGELVTPIGGAQVDCDIDLVDGDEDDEARGNESSSAAWDTSIMIGPAQDNDADSLGEHSGGPIGNEHSEFGEISLSIPDRNYCDNCKKNFKTVRQRNSHRCLNF